MQDRQIIRDHLKEGRYDDAATLLAAAKLDHETRHTLELWLAKSRGDFPAIRRLLDAQIVAGHATTETLISAGWACMRLLDYGSAAAHAARILGDDPHNLQAVRIASTAAVALADVVSAEHYLREALRLDPTDVRSGVHLLRLLNTIGRVRESAEYFEILHQMAPDDPHVRIIGFRYFAHSTRELRDTPPSENWASRAVKAVAARLQEELLSLRRILNRGPVDAALKRPIVDYAIGQEVLIGTAPAATLTAILFTGFTDQMMGLPIQSFDRYMAALGVNVIYLNDFRRLFFTGGVPHLADDYDGTLAVLRLMIADLGATRVAVIGASAGGLAAVLYGVDLGAETVVSFAGRSAPGDIYDTGERDSWSSLIEARLQQSGLAPKADLRAFLQSRRSSTRIELFYGADMGVDAHHAHMISEFPEVHTHPIAGLSTHTVIDHLAEHTNFLEVLRELLRLDP